MRHEGDCSGPEDDNESSHEGDVNNDPEPMIVEEQDSSQNLEGK